MRTTNHYARAHKDGTVFSSKHNDRSFSLDQDPTVKRTWYADHKNNPDLSFEEYEKQFYRKFFGQHLQAENDKKRAGGHASRVIDMDAYRRSVRTCPEEELLYIGNKTGSADLNTLWSIAVQQVTWEMKTYPDCRVLDMALHQEDGAPHIHIRRVWMANDGHGSWCVSQRKSLARMAVQPPDPTKPISRFNNPKMTYTADCRQHFQELCRARGFTIEDEPREPSKKSLDLLEYRVQELQKTADTLDVKTLRAELASMTQQRDAAVHQGAAYRKAYDKALEVLRHVRPDLVRELMSAVDDSIKKRVQDKTR